MKKIIFILALFVSSMGLTQDATNFNVSGNILNADDSRYLLYDVDEDGNWRFVRKVELDSTYNITVASYRTYLIIFKTDDDAKHMYLSLSGASKQYLSIDFKHDSHIVYYFDEQKHKYMFYFVEDSDIIQMYNHDDLYQEY